MRDQITIILSVIHCLCCLHRILTSDLDPVAQVAEDPHGGGTPFVLVVLCPTLECHQRLHVRHHRLEHRLCARGKGYSVRA